jgi:hypothetical protein
MDQGFGRTGPEEEITKEKSHSLIRDTSVLGRPVKIS